MIIVVSRLLIGSISKARIFTVKTPYKVKATFVPALYYISNSKVSRHVISFIRSKLSGLISRRK